MNKRELIRAISLTIDEGISQRVIGVVLDKAVEVVKDTLNKGEPVKISRFGTLLVKKIPSRRFYSPRYKGFIRSEGKVKIVFVASRLKTSSETE